MKQELVFYLTGTLGREVYFNQDDPFQCDQICAKLCHFEKIKVFGKKSWI